MTNRLDRARQVARAAQHAEDDARIELIEAADQLRRTAQAIEAAIEGAGRLADDEVPAGLRGHLVTVGARNLTVLSADEIEQRGDTERARDGWQQARRRRRSLEKLVERIETDLRQRQERSARAEWQDLVTSRAMAIQS